VTVRVLGLVLTAMTGLAPFGAIGDDHGSSAVPPVVARAAPGEGQHALQALEGRWTVQKKIFVALGTPDMPAVSESIHGPLL
jgi:hypothetical protein